MHLPVAAFDIYQTFITEINDANNHLLLEDNSVEDYDKKLKFVAAFKTREKYLENLAQYIQHLYQVIEDFKVQDYQYNLELH